VPIRYHRNKIGQLFPVEITRSEFLPDDRPLVISVIRDVSDLKKTEDITRRHERQLRRHNLALGALSRNGAGERGEILMAFQEITELTSRALEIERVSIWIFDRQRTKLVCRQLYERSWKRHSAGFSLSSVDYPSYFKALDLDRVIAARDVHSDPRTRDLS